MALYQLDDELWFPDPYSGEEDGLVAIGGDLSVERLLLAYSNGFFPWYAYKYYTEPLWYCPLDRFVIFPDKIHISHSMKQLLRKNRYEITFNQSFSEVIKNCSNCNDRSENEGAWLGPDIIEAYTKLHELGFAASVEVWDTNNDGDKTLVGLNDDANKTLVGGLYGVTLGKAFFGESMFSLVPNASKLALIYLAKFLENIGAHFIDCQFETPLFRSMGGTHITYEEYMQMLEK